MSSDQTPPGEAECEQLVMYRNLMAHVPEWAQVVSSPSDLEFRRLKGNSNACYM